MKFNRLLIVVIIITLAACSNNSQTANIISDPIEKQLLENLAKEPDNNLFIAQAGDFYRERFIATKNISDAKNSIQHYKRFLVDQPENDNANIALYDVYYRLHFNNLDNIQAELSEQFDRISKAQREYLSPPEVAEFYRLISLEDPNAQEKTYQSLALAGVKKSPKNPVAYLLLSGMYLDQKKHNLSAAILKQGLKHQPENYAILKYLGDTYSEKAYAKSCEFEDQKIWHNAVNNYSKAKKINPKDHELRLQLGEAYLIINKYQLGLHEIKSAYKQNANADTLIALSQAYVINGQYEKAKKIVSQDTVNNKNISAIISAQHALRGGAWQDALSHYQNHTFSSYNKYSFYNFIQATIAADLSNSNWRPNVDINAATTNFWPTQLISFWQDKIPPEELINKALNQCEKLEAYAYIGYKYFVNKELNHARKYLQLAIDQKIPFFVEDGMAKYLLQHINQLTL